MVLSNQQTQSWLKVLDTYSSSFLSLLWYLISFRGDQMAIQNGQWDLKKSGSTWSVNFQHVIMLSRILVVVLKDGYLLAKRNKNLNICGQHMVKCSSVIVGEKSTLLPRQITEHLQIQCRDHFVYVPSQWETMLLTKTSSLIGWVHWQNEACNIDISHMVCTIKPLI